MLSLSLPIRLHLFPPVIFITLPKYVKDVTSSKRGNIDHHLLPRTAINHDGLCLIRTDFKHKYR